MADKIDTSKELAEDFSKLLETGEFSDLTVTCQGAEFKVHKNVLCCRSQFFKNACKEGAFQESITGKIDLPDDDPTAVKAMLKFLYTGSYEIESNIHLNPWLPTKLYCLARKYGMDSLQELTFSMLNDRKWVWSLLGEDTWILVIKEIYVNSSEDDRIRRFLLAEVLSQLGDLLRKKESSFSKMMEELAEFGRDIARAVRYSVELGSPAFNSLQSHHDKAETRDFRCEDCVLDWRFKLGNFLGEELKCLLCCGGLAVLNDASLTLLYKWTCNHCEAEVWCSHNRHRLEWECLRCHFIKGFRGSRKPTHPYDALDSDEEY